MTGSIIVDVTYPLTIRFNTLDGWWVQCTECPTCWSFTIEDSDRTSGDALRLGLKHAEDEHWGSHGFEVQPHLVT